VNTLDDIEARLRATSLSWPAAGEHVSDGRLAQISEGDDPTEVEASHLVGCHECLPLLMVLGDGLQALADLEAEASGAVVLLPKSPRRSMGKTSVALILLAACAYAAVTWVMQSRTQVKVPRSQTKMPEVQAESKNAVAIDLGIPTQKTLVETERLKHSKSVTADVKTVGDLEGEPSVLDLAGLVETTIPPRIDTRQKGTAHGSTKPSRMPRHLAKARSASKAVVVKKVESQVRMRARTKTALKSNGSEAKPGGRPRITSTSLEGRDGPVEFTRQPVNAASRGFGQLRLNSRPAAEVFVDGKSRGWTPLFDLRLQAGPHDIRLVYKSPLAEKKQERFRVMIQPEKIWAAVRDNRKKSAE
jgi:hypothetical protein